MHKTGASNRDRTYDLRVTSALLYQLSYTGFTLCLIQFMRIIA